MNEKGTEDWETLEVNISTIVNFERVLYRNHENYANYVKLESWLVEIWEMFIDVVEGDGHWEEKGDPNRDSIHEISEEHCWRLIWWERYLGLGPQ
jgi:hypothetical protein